VNFSWFETHEPQDRGVEVVDVDFVFDGLESEFVGGAVDVALLLRPRPARCEARSGCGRGR